MSWTWPGPRLRVVDRAFFRAVAERDDDRIEVDRREQPLLRDGWRQQRQPGCRFSAGVHGRGYACGLSVTLRPRSNRAVPHPRRIARRPRARATHRWARGRREAFGGFRVRTRGRLLYA